MKILIIINVILLITAIVQTVTLLNIRKREREMKRKTLNVGKLKVKQEADLYQEMLDLARSDYVLGKITREEYQETIESINELVYRKIDEKCSKIEEAIYD